MKERLGEEMLRLRLWVGRVGRLVHQNCAYSQGSPSLSPGSSYPGKGCLPKPEPKVPEHQNRT